jgi:hypothetical protein
VLSADFGKRICRPVRSFLNNATIRTALLLVSLTHAAPHLWGEVASCNVKSNAFEGFQAYQLQNGLLSLWVVPDFGGRILQCQLDGHSFFYRGPTNLGQVTTEATNSTPTNSRSISGGDVLGLAPVGQETKTQWSGAEMSVLDTGKYEGQIIEQSSSLAAVSVTGSKDPVTGIQFKRTVSLYAGGTQVRMDCWMKNTGTRSCRWSLSARTGFDVSKALETTQGSNNFLVFASLRPGADADAAWSLLPAQATEWPFQIGVTSGLLAAKFEPRLARLGLAAADGWLAMLDTAHNYCFVQRFTAVNGARYPDRLPAAFWFNGPGELNLNGKLFLNPECATPVPPYLETQIFSPLVALDPGQDYHFQIDWYATRCPAPLVSFTPAGVIHQPVRLSKSEPLYQLSGVLGVFFQGHLEAVIKAKDGSILSRENLGAVDPRRVCILDQTLDLPDPARKLHLILLDEDQTHRGTLAELEITNR